MALGGLLHGLAEEAGVLVRHALVVVPVVPVLIFVVAVVVVGIIVINGFVSP